MNLLFITSPTVPKVRMVTSVSALGGDFGVLGVAGVPPSSSFHPPLESRDELRALPLMRVELISRSEVLALEATWHMASQIPRMKFMIDGPARG